MNTWPAWKGNHPRINLGVKDDNGVGRITSRQQSVRVVRRDKQKVLYQLHCAPLVHLTSLGELLESMPYCHQMHRIALSYSTNLADWKHGVVCSRYWSFGMAKALGGRIRVSWAHTAVIFSPILFRASTQWRTQESGIYVINVLFL